MRLLSLLLIIHLDDQKLMQKSFHLLDSSKQQRKVITGCRLLTAPLFFRELWLGLGLLTGYIKENAGFIPSHICI